MPLFYMALFDTYRINMLAKTRAIMGTIATWGVNSASVLFNAPTTHDQLAKVDYQRDRYVMEYDIEDFIGLRESVANGGNEYVIIDGVEYFILEINALYDGKLLEAVMKIKTDV